MGPSGESWIYYQSEPATLISAVREPARGNTIIAPAAGTLVDGFVRLAPTTVKTHMSNALAKRDARGRVQLVVQVYRAGFAGFKVASSNGPARTGGPAAAAPDDRADGTEVR